MIADPYLSLNLDYWHSDKLPYQSELAQKIAKLFTLIGEKLGLEKQKEWFEQFLYIFNLHWDKVDNYRIDKYLMFIRFQLHEVLHFLKKHDYAKETVLDWFNEQMKGLFLNENEMSKGIPLQVCDTFLQELNKVDAENISFASIAALLEPFLHTMANMKNTILLDRLEEKIFSPLLDNNITPANKSDDEDTDESSSEINYDPKAGKYWVDGGKLHPKTFKEVQKLIDQRFNFPNFNILLYA